MSGRAMRTLPALVVAAVAATMLTAYVRSDPYTGVDLGAPALACRSTVPQGTGVPRSFAGLG